LTSQYLVDTAKTPRQAEAQLRSTPGGAKNIKKAPPPAFLLLHQEHQGGPGVADRTLGGKVVKYLIFVKTTQGGS